MDSRPKDVEEKFLAVVTGIVGRGIGSETIQGYMFKK
jgi:hypothetical protein